MQLVGEGVFLQYGMIAKHDTGATYIILRRSAHGWACMAVGGMTTAALGTVGYISGFTGGWTIYRA